MECFVFFILLNLIYFFAFKPTICKKIENWSATMSYKSRFINPQSRGNGSKFSVGTDNASLMIDQKVRPRHRYHTVDKAIRHTMSMISSADGHCQQRRLTDQWRKWSERAVFPNAFYICSNRKWKRGERTVSGEIRISWWVNAKLIERIARSRDFPHCSASLLCWQWPSADEIVDIVWRISLSTKIPILFASRL